MTTNLQLEKQLDKILDELGEFQERYHDDMHGDSQVDGSLGLIGEVRQLKNYPSITWLIAHKTKSTLGAVMAIFAILQLIWSAGLYWIFLKLI